MNQLPTHEVYAVAGDDVSSESNPIQKQLLCNNNAAIAHKKRARDAAAQQVMSSTIVQHARHRRSKPILDPAVPIHTNHLHNRPANNEQPPNHSLSDLASQNAIIETFPQFMHNNLATRPATPTAGIPNNSINPIPGRKFSVCEIEMQLAMKENGIHSDEGSGSGTTDPNSTRLMILYKTEICRSWEETGTCRYGNKCQFAHSENELRSVHRHPKYKTEICRTFQERGWCPYGRRCCFLHNEYAQRTSRLSATPPPIIPMSFPQTHAKPPYLPIHSYDSLSNGPCQAYDGSESLEHEHMDVASLDSGLKVELGLDEPHSIILHPQFNLLAPADRSTASEQAAKTGKSWFNYTHSAIPHANLPSSVTSHISPKPPPTRLHKPHHSTAFACKPLQAKTGWSIWDFSPSELGHYASTPSSTHPSNNLVENAPSTKYPTSLYASSSVSPKLLDAFSTLNTTFNGSKDYSTVSSAFSTLGGGHKIFH